MLSRPFSIPGRFLHGLLRYDKPLSNYSTALIHLLLSGFAAVPQQHQKDESKKDVSDGPVPQPTHILYSKFNMSVWILLTCQVQKYKIYKRAYCFALCYLMRGCIKGKSVICPFCLRLGDTKTNSTAG